MLRELANGNEWKIMFDPSYENGDVQEMNAFFVCSFQMRMK